MPSAPESRTDITEDEFRAVVNQMIAAMRSLLNDVKEERRRLHIERHAIFQIVIQDGNLPMLHRLADMLEDQTGRRGKGLLT